MRRLRSLVLPIITAAALIYSVFSAVGCGAKTEAQEGAPSVAADIAADSPLNTYEDVPADDAENVTVAETADGSARSQQEPEPPLPESPKALTDEELKTLNVYECGEIMVIMYHGITEGDPPSYYQRQREDFAADLEALYSRGFRLISLNDVLDGNITTGAGFSPVVITFDDGISTSFSLMEGAEGLSPSPGCGLAIMQDFAKTNPDFGCTATFFINGDVDTFAGAGSLEDRLKYLVDNGFDIGNHTYSHPELNSLNAAEIQKEIALVDKIIRDAVPGYSPTALAYPKGIRPIDELKPLALNGEFEGISYSYKAALREGMSGAPSVPYREGYDPLNYPRARGSATENEPTDLWGKLVFYDERPEYRYISDGDPNTITCPAAFAGNVDGALSGGRALRVYD